MTSDPSQAPVSPPSDLYVGYLPMPQTHRRFLSVVVPVLLLVLGVAAVLWAGVTRDPGGGLWESAQTRTFVGRLVTRPYPMLLLGDEAGPPGDVLLLVEVGKHGTKARLDPLDGSRVELSGWTIDRDGRRMLELDPEVRPKLVDEARTVPVAKPITLGRITLRGEIVDSKCYGGAMKPGDGPAHKACATLCVRGGIPPVLIVQGESGRPQHYLLCSPDGSAMDPAIEPMIGEPVEVSGLESVRGSLRLLSVTPADVRRLGIVVTRASDSRHVN